MENASYSGNPFDVIATVTFEHQGSSKSHTTEMFHDGDDTWKFRFTGTRMGTWNFTTSSDDPELDGHSGSVEVAPNSDSDTYGFVTNVGDKWARQMGNSGAVEPFVPHFRETFEYEPSLSEYTDTFINNHLDVRMGEEGFNGVRISVYARWVDSELSSYAWPDTPKENPDPASFEALERLIEEIHSRGGVLHIWYVGDCFRDQCIQAGFGDNGASTDGERRILRYIAARLGPVPGWIMGYGYDNDEHVSTAALQDWGSYLRNHMGWNHYLGARDQTGGGTAYTFWPEANFYSHGQYSNGVDNSTVRDLFENTTDKTHSFDERWYKSRLGSEKAILRQLWTMNMAGGASAIWGWQGNANDHPYPHPEWFKTFFTFWENRFLSDMTPDNNLTDGYALTDASGKHFVVYKEDTSSIQIDLSGMNGSQPAVAVDTQRPYQEIDLGTLDPATQTISLPHSSDWAIAVGQFD